jgi:hypothetical protein
MSVCCECCMLSGRGLCDELIARPDESYRLLCVVVCDLETSRIRRPWLVLDRSATARKTRITNCDNTKTVQKCRSLDLVFHIITSLPFFPFLPYLSPFCFIFLFLVNFPFVSFVFIPHYSLDANSRFKNSPSFIEIS